MTSRSSDMDEVVACAIGSSIGAGGAGTGGAGAGGAGAVICGGAGAACMLGIGGAGADGAGLPVEF